MKRVFKMVIASLGELIVWTCLAPWNAMAVELAPADTTKQVNRGETTFTEQW